MEITESKVIETKREIKLPAYFKNEYSFYRVYEIGEEMFVDVIHDWDTSCGHELLLIKPYNHMSGCIPFDHDATETEFNDALDNFLLKVEVIINETRTTQGSDSFWALRKVMLPLHETK